VRPGLALYGYHLLFERAGRVVSGSGLRLSLKPVLTWKTRILSIREMKPGQALGYGGTYVTKAPARIGVLPVGYADGLNRGLSEGGRVIVREHYAPIVGRISMDLTLVDVTGIPGVSVADEVVLLGSEDGLNVDAREHAELALSTRHCFASLRAGPGTRCVPLGRTYARAVNDRDNSCQPSGKLLGGFRAMPVTAKPASPF